MVCSIRPGTVKLVDRYGPWFPNQSPEASPVAIGLWMEIFAHDFLVVYRRYGSVFSIDQLFEDTVQLHCRLPRFDCPGNDAFQGSYGIGNSTSKTCFHSPKSKFVRVPQCLPDIRRFTRNFVQVRFMNLEGQSKNRNFVHNLTT
ncbi:hypothetical protein PG997_009121 [Apiospora hydei]|uniref:Uncharacterized protein n=1 Tax=Apiospora hydei TaxID=1337664 RepID=A0ABR1VT69_9PEZI